MDRLEEEEGEVATLPLQLPPVHEAWTQPHHRLFHLLQITTEHRQLDQLPLLLLRHRMAQQLIKPAFTQADFVIFRQVCTQTSQQGLLVKATMLRLPSLLKDLGVVVVADPLLALATWQLHHLPPDILLGLAWDSVEIDSWQTSLVL